MRIFSKYFWTIDVYNTFRRDIWNFFANIWRFRQELYNHHWWDYHFTLQMMYRSISIMEKNMHNGYEIRQTRDKKIAKMQRVLFLLKSKIDDSYIELAEKELGLEIIHRGFDFEEIDEKDDNGQKLYRWVDNLTEVESDINSIIYKKSREIEESHWIELWDILKGQKYSLDLSSNLKEIPPVDQQIININNSPEYDDYYDNFDGSDMRGWWD